MAYGVLSTSIQNLGNDDSPQKAWFDEPGERRWEAWEAPVVVAMVNQDIESIQIAQHLQSVFSLSSPPQYTEEMLSDVDWVRETQKINQPNQISDRLWIIPTGHTSIDESVANIYVDPGIAFGSGTHPTTHLCLEWLSEHIQGGESVLDYGCGSGILAIAAIKLGAEIAMGVDIDPVCLTSTNDNGKYNQVSIPTYLPENLPQKQEFDIVIANILANPLIDLMPIFQSLLIANGQIVISGMMESQADKIIDAYKNHFSDLTLKTKSGWALISGVLV